MRIINLILLLLLFSSGVFAEKVSLSGYLKDESNGEALIGATVYVPELEIGVVTNSYGFYSLTMPTGEYTVQVSYIGYETQTQKVTMDKNQSLTIKLEEAAAMIDEVFVTSEAKNKNVESVTMSMEKVSVKTIKKLPAFMGEVDVIKSIQLLPGIQSGGEGSSGLYVRGGGPDENLLLLDEAPVYNASHLMGFFSVFNSDAIKDIQVYKGGIPAMYGGKASSVIDIRQKDGNSQELHGSASLGLLSSKLTLEGPIVKDKWTFLASGRRMYVDVVGKMAGIEELETNKLNFYDLNFKTNYIINDKNRIYCSAYNGEDQFQLGDLIYMHWGNSTATARWNHVFGGRLFANTSLIYSKYNYNLGVPSNTTDQFDWSSMIRDWNVKSDFTFFLNPDNQVKFGVNAFYHHFEPGKIEADSGSYFNDMELSHYNAAEMSVYVSNEQKIGSKIAVQYGLRLTYFQQMGEGEVREYADPENIDEDEIVSTATYENFDFIGNPFIHLEPRLSLKYSLGATSSVKGSYNRMVQNLHLITNTNAPTPLDIWLPSSKYIKPLIINQVALGYFRNFNDNMFETSIEIYYKDMQNVLDYKEGADLFLNETIETELVHGSGKSYGLELLAKKQQGKLTGWISYTLAKTTRKVPGVNNDEEYLSSYSRTHDVSLVLSYQINEHWNLSTNFVYASGNPITAPLAKYEVDGYTVFEYSGRNEYSLPDYNRLDLSATYEWNLDGRINHSLNLSFYNVYMRQNAFSVYFRENEDNPNQIEAVQLTIIGSIVPSFSYVIKF